MSTIASSVGRVERSEPRHSEAASRCLKNAAAAGDLAHRYVWSTAVDDLLADETVGDAAADDIAWTLGDHLHSVRDRVVSNRVSGTVSGAEHVVCNAYGNVTSDTAPAVLSLFLYTARPLDADTGLQDNLNRWYNARHRPLGEH